MSLTARPEITDKSRRVSAIDRLRTANVRLPTFRELAKPETVAANTETSLKAVEPNAADARNLWRVHWFNDATRKSRIAVPGHIVLPELLTGVQSPIVVLLGQRFPIIGAHKVLAAYTCLVPRLVTGQFDPAHDRTIWPSTTGNYCRGGVAISRILGCRGVAVLPGGMSASRHLEGVVDDHVLELTHVERKRVFNLGYYTWVEQQGVSIENFDRRRDQNFWRDSSTSFRPGTA